MSFFKKKQKKIDPNLIKVVFKSKLEDSTISAFNSTLNMLGQNSVTKIDNYTMTVDLGGGMMALSLLGQVIKKEFLGRDVEDIYVPNFPEGQNIMSSWEMMLIMGSNKQ